MKKTFMGVRLRTLREQHGLTQAALAQRLQLSPSYLNQIEHNQRPLSVAVLLRLQAELGADLQWFSEDDEARRVAELQDVAAEAAPDGVPAAELRALAQQMPAAAALLLRLHRRCRAAEERLATLGAQADDGRGGGGPALQPHEAVRDYFYARHNHIAALDEHAEALHAALPPAPPGRPDDELAARLEARLAEVHGVRTLRAAGDDGDGAPAALRRFDAATRTLAIAPWLTPGQRAFQLATQLATLDAGPLIDTLADEGRFDGPVAQALARIGLASYFAGALVLPYGRFLAAAEALRYDIERLGQRFGVGFETVCHRLSTLQRPGAPGVPFFFVRVDRAGNISKRQSASDFHFSRTGGTCPRWNVYEAFARPGEVLVQQARMPDGRTSLWIARRVGGRRAGYGTPGRSFAVALGCDIRHADRLVYAKGLDLKDADAATPIGAGCRVCDRTDCTQRAFPPLGRTLRVDPHERLAEPYAAR